MRWPWRGPCFASPTCRWLSTIRCRGNRLLVDRREDLVGQRVAVMNRLFWRLHQIDPGRPEPKKLQHAVRREALADYLGEQSGLQAELAAEEVADLCRCSVRTSTR